MSEENVPLKWDAKRHDDTVDRIQLLEANKHGRALVAMTYERWKKRLCKKQRTPQEVIAELYKLRDMVCDATKHMKGMKEWRVFTMNLIEDKISEFLKADFAVRNMATEWLEPDRRQNAEGLLIAEKGEFTNRQEFEALPFVRRFIVKEGFIGFYSSGMFINALFDGGEFMPVATVITTLGVTEYPTHKEIVGALGELPNPAGEAPGTPPRSTAKARRAAKADTGPADSGTAANPS